MFQILGNVARTFSHVSASFSDLPAVSRISRVVKTILLYTDRKKNTGGISSIGRRA